jgi:hypothetical protein
MAGFIPAITAIAKSPASDASEAGLFAFAAYC